MSGRNQTVLDAVRGREPGDDVADLIGDVLPRPIKESLRGLGTKTVSCHC